MHSTTRTRTEGLDSKCSRRLLDSIGAAFAIGDEISARFGNLFSLGVYSSRTDIGSSFYSRYCSLLRDAGRMETEALVDRLAPVRDGD